VARFISIDMFAEKHFGFRGGYKQLVISAQLQAAVPEATSKVEFHAGPVRLPGRHGGSS